MSLYLCYDIRGIQSFIFRIPHLKYIIGGSAIVDCFDKRTMRNTECTGCEWIYSAGGKGAFTCESREVASNLKKKIIDETRKVGLDIRFGMDEDFCSAAQKTDEVYPFIIDGLEGEPCGASGLYPTKNGTEHPMIRLRRDSKDWFEEQLDLPGLFPDIKAKLRFFSNVKSEGDSRQNNADAQEDIQDGNAGAAALGNRNRWAVICMDGNDMGSQFRMKIKSSPASDAFTTWISEMSHALDTCSVTATKNGIKDVVDAWFTDNKINPNEKYITLPIRPLIVGGDDIAILCHVSYANLFIEKAIQVFNETSKNIEAEFRQKHEGMKLWPATDGCGVTISAGILYCSVTLPLHSAIQYAEELLKSAKRKGRRIQRAGEAPPPCVDWEQVTETLIDTPAARRKRELEFFDGDINKSVRLTQRPYTFAEYKRLIDDARNQYGQIPASLRYQILPAMKKAYNDRLAFAAMIRKNKCSRKISDDLCEYPGSLEKSKWKAGEDGFRTTDVVDKLLLLEEDHRISKETVHG